MNINAERFFALTAMLAAPLVTASACVITDADDDDAAGTDSNSSPSTTVSATDSTTMTTADPTTDATSMSTGDVTGDPTGDTTVDPTDPGTTGAETGTTGGNALGNCCEPDGSLGCEVPEVQDCVCELDPYCCETGWDSSCAGEVNTFQCGMCDFPPAPYDCTCLADCDGVTVDTPWQVCGTDFDSAAMAGQAACEADLGANCKMFSCEECDCSTAEIAKIQCEE